MKNMMPITTRNLNRQQQKALHLFYGQLADVLNAAGMDMGTILSRFVLDIPATKTNVKEMIWRPIQEAMYAKKSTTELEMAEIDKIYDVICKFFAERDISIPAFPSIESQNETYYQRKKKEKVAKAWENVNNLSEEEFFKQNNLL